MSGLTGIVLALILTYLNVNHIINISWWIALAPLYIPFAIGLVLLAAFLFVFLLALVVKVFS
jgi:hypothetical protein